MNIDLLLTDRHEAGLVCDQPWGGVVAGVMFDTDSGLLSIEFPDHDTLDLNIPVQESFIEPLTLSLTFHMGALVGEQIVESRQVPLLFLNDPSANVGFGRMARPRSSVLDFERFLKACIAGQPIHRDDLGDEDSTGSVIGGVNTALLKFAPNLARQRLMETAPHLAPRAPGIGPAVGPAGRSPTGPGGLRASGGARRAPPRQNKSDESEDG